MIFPDGFVGGIMAVEGIENARAFIHGPNGCRRSLVCFSRRGIERECPVGQDRNSLSFFHRSDRIPSSNVFPQDYVSGSDACLRSSFESLRSSTGPLVVFFSPGLRLSGDDVKSVAREAGVQDKTILMDEDLSSRPFCVGFDLVMRSLVMHLPQGPSKTRKGTVNILGLSTWDRDWRSVREDVEELLSNMDLEVIAFPGAGSSTADIQRSVEAEFNIVLCPEFCRETCKYYEGTHSITTVTSDYGAPVGFDATASWLKHIADATGRSADRAIEVVNRHRKRAAHILDSIRTPMPIEGMTFSISSRSSIALPLTRWLYEWLSMVPIRVVLDPGYDPRLAKDLEEFTNGFCHERVVGDSLDVRSNVILADGNSADVLRERGMCDCAIGLSCPISRSDVMARPIYLQRGALHILDTILNHRWY